MRILLLLAVTLLAATPAFAATAESPSRMSAVPSVENMSTEQFLAWHDGVRRDISAGRYGKLDNRTVETIDAQEILIHARLHDGKQLSELSESARLDVFNAHERIVALLNGNEDERMVCTREHQVGSHRPRVTCMSERDRQLAADQNKLRNIHKDASID